MRRTARRSRRERHGRGHDARGACAGAPRRRCAEAARPRLSMRPARRARSVECRAQRQRRLRGREILEIDRGAARIEERSYALDRVALRPELIEEDVDVAAALVRAVLRNGAAVFEAEVVDRHGQTPELSVDPSGCLHQAADDFDGAVAGPWVAGGIEAEAGASREVATPPPARPSLGFRRRSSRRRSSRCAAWGRAVAGGRFAVCGRPSAGGARFLGLHR